MIEVKGKKTHLVEVSESDTKLIVELRNKPSINRFLSSSKEITLEDQLVWIRNNKKKSNNHYFKITDLSNEFFGTISIYNIENRQGEFGRFIATNPIHAVEAEYLILRFGFEDLNLNKIYCRTVNDNKSVWNQHYKFGFVDDGELVWDIGLGVSLKVQEITKDMFASFDYTPILKLISRF
jgi:RimJ/RimL family protein N-acetyltransferase